MHSSSYRLSPSITQNNAFSEVSASCGATSECMRCYVGRSEPNQFGSGLKEHASNVSTRCVVLAWWLGVVKKVWARTRHRGRQNRTTDIRDASDHGGFSLGPLGLFGGQVSNKPTITHTYVYPRERSSSVLVDAVRRVLGSLKISSAGKHRWACCAIPLRAAPLSVS